MPKFTGAGGVVWDVDVPDEGTPARERFDAQVASGALVPVDDAPAPARKRTQAKVED